MPQRTLNGPGCGSELHLFAKGSFSLLCLTIWEFTSERKAPGLENGLLRIEHNGNLECLRWHHPCKAGHTTPHEVPAESWNWKFNIFPELTWTLVDNVTVIWEARFPSADRFLGKVTQGAFDIQCLVRDCRQVRQYIRPLECLSTQLRWLFHTRGLSRACGRPTVVTCWILPLGRFLLSKDLPWQVSVSVRRKYYQVHRASVSSHRTILFMRDLWGNGVVKDGGWPKLARCIFLSREMSSVPSVSAPCWV